jgi:hypothetical protein
LGAARRRFAEPSQGAADEFPVRRNKEINSSEHRILSGRAANFAGLNRESGNRADRKAGGGRFYPIYGKNGVMGDLRTFFIPKLLNLHLPLTFAQSLLCRRPV